MLRRKMPGCFLRSADLMETANNNRLLVVTPTLGDSPFLDASVDAVRHLRTQITILHVLVAPPETVPLLRARFPECEIIPDAGREGGMYGAINNGLHLRSDWDWFTYINDDDLLMPDFAGVFAEHCRSANPRVIAYGDVRNIRENGDSLGLQTVETSARYFPALLRQGISLFTQQGAIASREVVELLNGFDPSLRLCGDLDFWVRALAAGFEFRYYHSEVGQFRIRAGQLSGDVPARLAEREIILRKLPLLGIPSARLHFARIRFRLLNLPRYVERIRAAGWRRSNDLISGGGTDLAVARSKP